MKKAAVARTFLLLFSFLLAAVQSTSPFAVSSVFVKAVASPRTIIVPDDFPTIKKAIDNASAGDTVYVKAGTYDIAAEGYYYFIVAFNAFCCLPIDKPISLIGENCQNTIINATGEDINAYFFVGISVRADNVTISGFTITSVRTALNLGGNNDTFTGNIIKITGEGLGVSIVNGNVSSNIIEGANRGDGVMANTNSIVYNNTIRNFNVGITSFLTDYNQSIFDNIIANNSIGLRLTVPALFYHNNIENCSQYSAVCVTSGNVSGAYNWWGTTNRQEISQKIFDNKNDSNLGTVAFEPFLTRPYADSNHSPLIFTMLVVCGVSLAIIGAGLLVYFKKRKR